MMEITEDTVVFLRDIHSTADAIKEESGRLMVSDAMLEGVLENPDTPATDAQTLEDTLDDIASELFRQYQRLQNISFISKKTKKVLECDKCHEPIETLEELFQIPVGIVRPELTCTPVSGELLNYHKACTELR
jgi:hypothetical protein